MSQHWHGHWTEDTFQSRKLCNWQVPKWHPKWPDRHCGSTKIQVNDSGRFLPGIKTNRASPWGDYKGTWDLPLKITRRVSSELSSAPNRQFKKWEQHLTYNREKCDAEDARRVKVRVS